MNTEERAEPTEPAEERPKGPRPVAIIPTTKAPRIIVEGEVEGGDDELNAMLPEGHRWFLAKVDGEEVRVAATDEGHVEKLLREAYPGAKTRRAPSEQAYALLNKWKRRPNAKQRARANVQHPGADPAPNKGSTYNKQRRGANR